MSNDNPPIDQVIDDEPRGSDLEQNIKSRSTWLRLLFIVAFYLIAGLVGMVGSLIVVLGFLWVLFTGETNRQLQQAGQFVAGYLYEIVRYVTYNTDDRPFPFGGELPKTVAE